MYIMREKLFVSAWALATYGVWYPAVSRVNANPFDVRGIYYLIDGVY